MAHSTSLFDESRICYFLEAPLNMRLMLIYVCLSSSILSLFYFISYWDTINIQSLFLPSVLLFLSL